ncbi:MAG: ComEC family competence protein, partial [Chloroflexi bacterium]|nr:ComEC family competence protein [Chloroflexota bacterium]
AALSLAAGIIIAQALLRQNWFVCQGETLSPSILWWWLPLPFLILGLWRSRRSHLFLPLVAITWALLGVWRYLDHPFYPCAGPHALLHYHADSAYARPLTLEGTVIGYPEKRANYTQYKVRVDTLWQGSEILPVEGVALVRNQGQEAFQYGDRLRIRGTPISPPSFPDFDYRRFLARKGIYTLIQRSELTLLAKEQGNPFWAGLYSVRAAASQILDRLLPQPYAALANGMILGIESNIPRELYDKFNLTGASHVIVISGSNIAIVSGILLGLFSRLLGKRKRLATSITISGILLYTLLVGADAAVLRAALMGIFYVIAVHLERQSTAIISLFVAAVIMLLLNPLTLWDVGFQLSFMATLGLILFNSPLKTHWDRLVGQHLPGLINGLLAEGLLVTLAAQLTTMPLVVYYFGRLSLISFLVNLLIIPVQPPIMIMGGLATMLGFWAMPLAKLVMLIPWASLWWTVFVVEKMAAIPWGSLEVSDFGRFLAALYVGVFLAGFVLWLIRQEQQADSFIPPEWRPALSRGLIAVAFVALPLWGGATWQENQADGRLHIYLLGGEQGVDFVLFTPGGNRILVTAARDSSSELSERIAQTRGGRRPLSLLILTRPFSQPPVLNPSPAQTISATDPRLPPGTIFSLDTNVFLRLLQQPQSDKDSPLFCLHYHQFSMLLPFENSQEAQRAVLSKLPAHVTILPAPYPTVGAWPAPELLTKLKPQVTLLPTGTTYPPKVQRILAASSQVVSIPSQAQIEVITDGNQFSIRAYSYSKSVPIS